jgi:hypothetical protein
MAFRTHTRQDVREVSGAATEARGTDTPVVVDERSAVVERRTHEYPAWSPAQIIGLIIGIGMTVLGIAAVAQTGFDTADIYQPHDMVWGLPHSPLLAVCEIGFGALMIVASIVPGGLRWLMALLGVIALGFGILIMVDSVRDDLTRWFGVSENRSAWFFVVVGAVSILTALLSPVFYPRRRHEVVDVRDSRARDTRARGAYS